MANTLNGRLARAIDGAVLWRLGLIGVTPAGPDQTEISDPAAFWAASRVAAPAPLQARMLPAAPWARLVPRAQRPAFLELGGPSRGPGDHWGATSLRARVAINARPQAPLVLLLHGYAVPAPWYEERQMQLLVRRGFSVARLDLPFHLSRRIPGHAPGSGFFSSDPAGTLAVLCQAVEDAAAVVAWARAELGVRVAVHGVSLGGLVGGLLACASTLDAAVLITPPSDLVQIFMELAPLRLRRELGVLDGQGGPWAADGAAAREYLSARLAPVTLTRLRLQTAPERTVLVAADHDRIVGAGPVRQAAAGWGAECWEYSLGHVTLVAARGLMGRVHQRLAADLIAPAAQVHSAAM